MNNTGDTININIIINNNTCVCKKIKCNRCKKELPVEQFKINRYGRYQKNCIECNKKRAEWLRKYKCIHNKRKDRCKYCDGGKINTEIASPNSCRTWRAPSSSISSNTDSPRSSWLRIAVFGVP